MAKKHNEKAIMACASVGADPCHRLADISKTMTSGKSAERPIKDGNYLLRVSSDGHLGGETWLIH